jgi:hypothetical protein
MGDIFLVFKTHKWLDKPYKMIDEQDDWYQYEISFIELGNDQEEFEMDFAMVESIKNDSELQAFDVRFYFRPDWITETYQ